MRIKNGYYCKDCCYYFEDDINSSCCKDSLYEEVKPYNAACNSFTTDEDIDTDYYIEDFYEDDEKDW